MRPAVASVALAVLVLVAGASVAIGPPAGASSTRVGPPTGSDTWTILVYMAGDNSLSSAIAGDLSEIQAGGLSSEVTVVCYADGSGAGDATLWEISSSVVQLSLASAGLPMEPDMGDPDVASEFALWGLSSYPADRYGWVWWDHGGGWLDLCHDGSHVDHLTMAEVREILATATTVVGSRLDLVGSDCCYMGAAEMASEVRPYAQVYVGSAEYEGWDGWDYTAVLEALREDPTMDGESLGTEIVDAYGASYATSSYTLSAVNLTDYLACETAVSDLAESLRRVAGTLSVELGAARSAAYSYIDTGGYSYLDLGDLCGEIYDRASNATVRARAAAAYSALNDSIVAECHGAGADHTGLSIYWPPATSYRPSYGTTSFSTATAWDSFLLSYFRSSDLDTIAPGTPTMEEGPGVLYVNATLGRSSSAGVWVTVDGGAWRVATDISIGSGTHTITARVYDGVSWGGSNTTTSTASRILATALPYVTRSMEAGYHVVSLPVQGITYRASQLAELLGASQVADYTASGYLRDWRADGGPLVLDFVIRPGRAYWVYVDDPGTVQWVGDPWGSRTIVVSRGFALLPIGRSLTSAEFWDANPSIDYAAYWQDGQWNGLWRSDRSHTFVRGSGVMVWADTATGVVI